MNIFTFFRISNLNLVFLILPFIGVGRSSVEIPRPRGVSLSRASLYDPEKDFTCFDGSNTIPFDQVNDDYCDCPDGSDEPGTSACPGGSFHCSNAGFKPEILSSDRVNDGICDCCDGTDEYSGKKTCVNNCLEVGRAAREEAARLAELFKLGKQLRADLAQEGQKMKNEKQEKLNELTKNKEEAEKVRLEREEIKKKAEELENNALEYYRELEDQYKKKKAEQEAEKLKEEAVENFKKFDSNQDGLIDIAEIQSRSSFDRDRNGQVSEEEAKLFLNNQDSVDLEIFIEKSWPLMKPFVSIDSSIYKPPVTDSELEGEEQEGHEEQEKSLGEVEEGEIEQDDEDDEEVEPEETQEAEEHKVEYDEETQKLVDQATEARNQYNDADRDVKSINDQIRQIEESLKKDFGPEEEFASLEGQCFEFKNIEYTYKLCPFEKTLQIPNSNSMETSLGRWGKWDGPSGNSYSTMLYDNGQNCWNGPNRSTKVNLFCGTENKVTSVSEPNRRRVLAATGISKNTLQKIKKEGAVVHANEASTSFGSPNRKKLRKKLQLDPTNTYAIKNIIYDFYTIEKRSPTVKGILQKMKDAQLDFDGCAETLRKLIHSIGFSWRKTEDNRSVLIEKHEIRIKRIKFLKELIKYRAEGRNIIYTDETYIHSSHTQSKRWSDGSGKELKKPISKGKRLIIVHAGGEAGFIPNGLLIFKSDASMRLILKHQLHVTYPDRMMAKQTSTMSYRQ